MSARIFNDLTVYGTAASADVALERLLDQHIVNRFNGTSFASYDGPIPNGGTALGTVGERGRILASSGGTNFTWNRTYAFVGATLYVDSVWEASLPVLSAQCHMHFFNCTFLLTGNFSGTTGSIFGDINEPNRSVNYYGCNFIVAPGSITNTGQLTTRPEIFCSDMIYCNLKVVNNSEVFLEAELNDAIPSRIIGNTISRTAENQGGRDVFDVGLISFNMDESNLKPPVFENCVIDNTYITDGFGATSGPDSLGTNIVLSNIQFTNTRRSFPRFRLEGGRSGNRGSYGTFDSIVHNVGGTYPSDNTMLGTFNPEASDVNPSAYIDSNFNVPYGGMINYYGWRPRFVNEFNQPIANVTVRALSNVVLSDPTATPTRTGLNQAITRIDGYADRTALPYNAINQYLTGSDGFVNLSAASYSTDGGATFSEGTIDWFKLGPVSRTGTENTNKLASTFENGSPPDNVIALPIQNLRGASDVEFGPVRFAYNQYGSRVLARSYLNVLDYDSGIQNGRIGTGPGAQPADGYVPIEEPVIEAPNDRWLSFDREGTVFASQAAAFAFFNNLGPRSPQDLSDYLKAVWANFQIDTLRGVSGGALTWTTGNVTISPTNTDNALSDSDLEINRISEFNAETSDRPVISLAVPNNTLTINCPTSGVDMEGSTVILNGNTSLGRYNALNAAITVASGSTHTNSTFITRVEAVGSATFNNCNIEGDIILSNNQIAFNGTTIEGTIRSQPTINRTFSGGRYTGGIDAYGGDTLSFTNAASIDDGFTLPMVTPSGGKTLSLDPGVGSPAFRSYAEGRGWTVATVTGDYSFIVGPRAGFFALLNRDRTTGNISNMQNVSENSNVPIVISENDPNFSQGDRVRAYYRPLNNYTTGSEEWYETTTLDFIWDTGDISRTIMMGPIELPEEIRSDAVYNGTDGNPAMLSTAVNDITDGLDITIDNADQVGTGLSSSISKNLMSRVQNDQNYLTLMARRDRIQDLIRPTVNGTILETGIELTTTLSAQIQQKMQGLQGGFTIRNFNAPANTVPTVTNIASELGLTVSDAREAMDRSAVANGVGYMVGAEDSALVGIAPRNNGVDYDSTENYRGNI